MTSATLAMHDAVRAVLQDVTAIPNSRRLAADADLKDAGMTSFELIAVLMQAEETFGVALPDEAITPANVASIAAIAATIDRQRALQAGR